MPIISFCRLTVVDAINTAFNCWLFKPFFLMCNRHACPAVLICDCLAGFCLSSTGRAYCPVPSSHSGLFVLKFFPMLFSLVVILPVWCEARTAFGMPFTIGVTRLFAELEECTPTFQLFLVF
jgi:hypothetical protein